jgi:hypothetical protein
MLSSAFFLGLRRGSILVDQAIEDLRQPHPVKTDCTDLHGSITSRTPVP